MSLTPRSLREKVLEWREARQLKLAQRLQINSDKSRVVSCSVLGISEKKQVQLPTPPQTKNQEKRTPSAAGTHHSAGLHLKKSLSYGELRSYQRHSFYGQAPRSSEMNQQATIRSRYGHHQSEHVQPKSPYFHQNRTASVPRSEPRISSMRQSNAHNTLYRKSSFKDVKSINTNHNTYKSALHKRLSVSKQPMTPKVVRTVTFEDEKNDTPPAGPSREITFTQESASPIKGPSSHVEQPAEEALNSTFTKEDDEQTPENNFVGLNVTQSSLVESVQAIKTIDVMTDESPVISGTDIENSLSPRSSLTPVQILIPDPCLIDVLPESEVDSNKENVSTTTKVNEKNTTKTEVSEEDVTVIEHTEQIATLDSTEENTTSTTEVAEENATITAPSEQKTTWEVAEENTSTIKVSEENVIVIEPFEQNTTLEVTEGNTAVHLEDTSPELCDNPAATQKVTKEKTKDITNVTNKLDDMFITPSKNSRKSRVLLDTTNIVESSTIEYVLRETKNDVIITSVRRSTRNKTQTPASVKAMKQAMTPEKLLSAKLLQNPFLK